MTWKGLLLSSFLFLTPVAGSTIGVIDFSEEKTYSRQEYIEMWKEEAIRQMYLYKIPASITLAQGILESGDGNSMLARKANNHFGIKCNNWEGETVFKDDDKKNECFRKYRNAQDSYKDHSEFLAKKERYSRLFTLRLTDYKGWAKGLRECGYATNPKYAELLIQLIEDNQLYEYDQYQYEPEPVVVSTQKPNVNSSESPSSTIINAATTPVKEEVLVISENRVKYTVAKEGDTFYKIAREHHLGLWQIYQYNDLGKDNVLMAGDVVYLQPKKNKAKTEFHTVRKGESMRDISQQYGIKLKKLHKKNQMPFDAAPKEGQKLRLR